MRCAGDLKTAVAAVTVAAVVVVDFHAPRDDVAKSHTERALDERELGRSICIVAVVGCDNFGVLVDAICLGHSCLRKEGCSRQLQSRQRNVFALHRDSVWLFGNNSGSMGFRLYCFDIRFLGVNGELLSCLGEV